MCVRRAWGFLTCLAIFVDLRARCDDVALLREEVDCCDLVRGLLDGRSEYLIVIHVGKGWKFLDKHGELAALGYGYAFA